MWGAGALKDAQHDRADEGDRKIGGGNAQAIDEGTRGIHGTLPCRGAVRVTVEMEMRSRREK